MWQFPLLNIPHSSHINPRTNSNIIKIINGENVDADRCNIQKYRSDVIEALKPQLRIIEQKWELSSVAENITEMFVERVTDNYTGLRTGGGLGLTCRWTVECYDKASEVRLYLKDHMASVEEVYHIVSNSSKGGLIVFPSYVPYIPIFKPDTCGIQTTVICFTIQYSIPRPLKSLQKVCAKAELHNHHKPAILHFRAPEHFKYTKREILDELEKEESFHRCTVPGEISEGEKDEMKTDWYDTRFALHFKPPKYCQKVLDFFEREFKILENIFGIPPISAKNISKMWFQSTTGEQCHDVHTHGQGLKHLSFVWYLEFDPKIHHATTFYCPFHDPFTGELLKSEVKNVKEGDLLVFPSRMYHEQRASKSDIRRTIISFNYQPTREFYEKAQSRKTF